MKVKYWIFYFLLVIGFLCYAQTPGQWTWVSGSNQNNYAGSYGVLGVADTSSKPPGVYEAVEWSTKDGIFWFYGGESSAAFLGDLWKYDPSSNRWTWVQGPGGTSDLQPVYGTRLTPSINNTPGERSESCSWTDTSGNLWLYGGISYKEPGGAQPYSDLWRYNIPTNSWTWMKGGQGPIAPGHYGTLGVEDSLNNPPPINEMDITWVDGQNDLWMLDPNGCLWKYRTTTNNWTWMKGDTNGYALYGTRFVPGPANRPGRTGFDYTRWKDSKGKFWYLSSLAASYKILWKYDPTINEWAWMWGDTATGQSHNYSGYHASLEPVTLTHIRAAKRALAGQTLWIICG